MRETKVENKVSSKGSAHYHLGIQLVLALLQVLKRSVFTTLNTVIALAWANTPLN